MGSPNAILRKEVDGKVIVRTGRRIPGVLPVAGVYAPITVVRRAVDDAYGAEERREIGPDGDEWAYRVEKISRSTCHAVLPYTPFTVPSAPARRSLAGRSIRFRRSMSGC